MSAPNNSPSWMRQLSGLLSLAVRVPSILLRALLPRIHDNPQRRAFMHGKFFNRLAPRRFPPLITRLPRETESLSADRPLDSENISGISIAPVPATDFGRNELQRSVPLHRPPGAIREQEFLAGCTSCGDCMDACPHDAIRAAPKRLGPAAGTPIIDADSTACMMCEDFPCIAACSEGVLSAVLEPIMGTARVTNHLCLAHHSTTCNVCVERCPVVGGMVAYDGKPTVNQDRCTGCGVCRYVCPAPENAILLMPIYARPGLPTT